MKKFLFLSAAAVALLGTSCAQEDISPVDNNDGMTTIRVSIPADLTSRYGEGNMATKLYVAIYPQYEDVAIFSNFPNSTKTAGFTVGDFGAPDADNMRTAYVKVPLVKNDTYSVLCWAQNPTCSDYKWVEEDQMITISYGTDNTIANFAEERDAFFGQDTNFKSTGNGGTIILKRPFAQINVGTADWDKYLAAFGSEDTEFGLTIEGVSNQLSLYSGKISTNNSNPSSITVEGQMYNKNTAQAFPVSDPECIYLAMAYVLADHNLTVGLTGISDYKPWNSVPAKMNYRTNIYGDLLTNTENLIIQLSSDFGGVNDFPVAQVSYVDGKIVCANPVLPAGVTANDIKNYGGVYLDEAGTPQYFAATGTDLATAMQNASTIYLAPNATINNVATLNVPQTGVTIYGNGATFAGANRRFDIANDSYAKGSNVDININALNNFNINGNPNAACTFNINLRDCALNGTGLDDGSQILTMAPVSANTNINTLNLVMDNCYITNVREGAYITLPGTATFTNCTFVNDAIGINYAKKGAGKTLDVTFDNCTFTDCGVAADSGNQVALYSAPVRVIDNTDTNKTTLTIDNCKFSGTHSQYDVLVWDFRDASNCYTVKYNITNSGTVTVGNNK